MEPLTALRIFVLVGFAALSARAADAPSLEYQVKATFLLNYTKFTDWPAAAFTDSGSPISICILGIDPFGAALDQILEGEEVNNRKVAVQRIKRAPAPRACQVLFVAGAEKADLKLLSDIGPGVLTVGEGPAFLRAGGMVTFVIENRRVRFDINQMAAESAGLKLSAKLLSVARTVE